MTRQRDAYGRAAHWQPSGPDWAVGASHAFIRHHTEAFPATMLGLECGVLTLQREESEGPLHLSVERPDLLAATLQRGDLSRHEGDPVALVNPGAGLMGVAVGPAELPTRIEILAVVEVGTEPPSCIPAGEAQPRWLLFRAHRTDTGSQAAPAADS